MKIRVTIDLDEADTSMSNWANEHTDTYRNGVLGVDKEGVRHMYYQSRNNLIEFEDVEVLN
jgi:hypothetical protein